MGTIISFFYNNEFDEFDENFDTVFFKLNKKIKNSYEYNLSYSNNLKEKNVKLKTRKRLFTI